jgi:hypothetical protein
MEALDINIKVMDTEWPAKRRASYIIEGRPLAYRQLGQILGEARLNVSSLSFCHYTNSISKLQQHACSPDSLARGQASRAGDGPDS